MEDKFCVILQGWGDGGENNVCQYKIPLLNEKQFYIPGPKQQR